MNLKRFFKQNEKIRNIYHPEIYPNIVKSFIGPGTHGSKTQYYTWKGEELLDMTIGRYHAADRHITEVAMKLNSEELTKYLNIIIDHLEKPDKDGGIKIGLAIAKLYELKERTKLLASKDTLLRLASVCYVDDTEILDGYDYKHGNMKIKLWRENNFYDFFFIKPMSKLLPLDKYSKDIFLDYLTKAEEEIRKSHSLMEIR